MSINRELAALIKESEEDPEERRKLFADCENILDKRVGTARDDLKSVVDRAYAKI